MIKLLIGLTIYSLGTCISMEALHAQDISLDLGGGVKMDFVWVPVNGADGTASIEIGDFSGTNVKEPRHTESISGPFQQPSKGFGYYLGKTEVTEAQWAIVTGVGSKSKLPVVKKTFNKIQDFIEAINAKTVQISSFPHTGDGSLGVVRLPTEAEWEYAARGGSLAVNYQGNDPYQGDIEKHEVLATPGSGGRAREAGTLPPNSLGLHDMLGNVREFVEGSYSVGGRIGGYLLKGGSYLSERQEIRSSARNEQPRSGEASKRPDAGFRLCISAEVFTSLGQAKQVKEKLKNDQEKEAQAKAKNDEAARLEQKLKQAEAEAVKAREESERLSQDAALAEKRKALEVAEKNANEEKAKLEAQKKQLANGIVQSPLPQENTTIVAEGVASSALTSLSDSKKSKSSPYENSLGMKFAPVPGTDVLFSAWDTRVKDFQAYTEAAGYRQQGGIYVDDGSKWSLDATKSWENPGFQQTELHPVVGVNWEEAKAFCQWLTTKERREGKISASQEYRLPTDSEWNMALGSTKYPWGNEWPPPNGAGNYDPSLGVDSYVNTSPVGSFTANRFGLFDMGGNVWQWCEDWYRSDLNDRSVLETSPELKDDGGGQKLRVIRGGSWINNIPNNLLSSFRGSDSSEIRCNYYGFRCVLSLDLAKQNAAEETLQPKQPSLLPALSQSGFLPISGGLIVYKTKAFYEDKLAEAMIFAAAIPRGPTTTQYIGLGGQSVMVPSDGNLEFYTSQEINVTNLSPGSELEKYRSTMERLQGLSQINLNIANTLAPILERMRSNIQMADSGKVMISGQWKANPYSTPPPLQRAIKQAHFKSLTTTDGDTYKNVTYKSSDEQKVLFSHEEGATRVPWDSLKRDDQLLWGYDAVKVKAEKLAEEKKAEENRISEKLAQKKVDQERAKTEKLAQEERARNEESEQKELALRKAKEEALARLQNMIADKIAAQKKAEEEKAKVDGER